MTMIMRMILGGWIGTLYTAAAVALMLLTAAATDPADRPAYYIENALSLRLEGGPEAVQSMDSHGGFHGDGVRYIELALDADACERFAAQLEQNPEWHALPLSEDAKAIFYGTEREENGMLYSRSAHTPEGVEIPPVEDGFWRLIDRQEGEPEHIFDESRYSRNFTAALLDRSRGRLYFLEVDT